MFDNQNQGYQTQPGTSEVIGKPREPLIPTLVDQLMKSVQEGLATADQLENRLSGILRPSTPSGAATGSEAQPVRAILVEHLSQLLQGIRVLNGRLNSITNRLEL